MKRYYYRLKTTEEGRLLLGIAERMKLPRLAPDEHVVMDGMLFHNGQDDWRVSEMKYTPCSCEEVESLEEMVCYLVTRITPRTVEKVDPTWKIGCRRVAWSKKGQWLRIEGDNEKQEVPIEVSWKELEEIRHIGMDIRLRYKKEVWVQE